MITVIRALLSKFAWQIGASAAVVALLTVSGFLVAAQVENHRVTELNNVLDARISDPVTGYVVRLAQAQTNAITVTTALERQVADLKAAAAAADARLRETEANLATAQRESREARRQAAQILNPAPRGDTLEDRVLDVDARILDSLK